MNGQVRTFISIDIPITDEIKDILKELKLTSNIRPSPVSQIHITLKFLGDTDQKKIPILCSKLKEAFADMHPFEISMKGIGAFPNERNPRVLWIGIEKNDVLMDCADIVENVLSSMRLQFDEKRFSPHVTVGRINGKADISKIMEDRKDTVFCRFECSKINVMKSELSPTGAKHTVMDSIILG